MPVTARFTRLELERRRRKWTQTVLAYHTGLHQSRISSYESGTDIPSKTDTIRLAAALGIPPESLLDEVSYGPDEVPPPPTSEDLGARIREYRARLAAKNG